MLQLNERSTNNKIYICIKMQFRYLAVTVAFKEVEIESLGPLQLQCIPVLFNSA